MHQILKIFIITAFCCAMSYAEEPSHLNSSWPNLVTRARHFHKRCHHSPSCHDVIRNAPPGPPGPPGFPGLPGFQGSNIFALANFFLLSNTPVTVPFNPAFGLGIIPLTTGNVAVGITFDPATSELIIVTPGDYVLDFAMTINNALGSPSTIYTVGIVKRNLSQGQTAFETVQTYAIQLPDSTSTNNHAFSLVGEVMLTLAVGDRLALANLTNPILSFELFGTPPVFVDRPATDTPATINLRLLNGA